MKRRLEGVRMSIPTNTQDLPVFTRKARPGAVPPELLALPLDAQVKYIDNIGRITGYGICKAGDYVQELISIIEEQDKGYFTINDAAEILKDTHGGDAERWRAELWREIKAGTLKVLDTDIHRPVLDLSTVRDFVHHLRASDMVAAGIPFPLQSAALPVVGEVMPCDVQADAGQGWSLKTSNLRYSGYRWPLHQALKAAHIAGRPRPTARDILAAWTANPPPDVQAMPDGVKYNNGLGKPREADSKAIQQAIKGLTN